MPEEPSNHNFFLYGLIGGCVAVIATSFYFFYYKKDYDFIVEVPCDSTKETCFVRDCSEADVCPPNNLSSFKRYSLKAADFKMCTNEDCTQVCETGAIKCELQACVEDVEVGESCLSPANSVIPE